jgi:DNA-binding transcriptional LysR family regulator
MALSDHVEKLNYFLKAAEFGSISRAAKTLRISQAGLSKSIVSLEQTIDAKLFIRSVNGIVLTKEGELVLAAAKEIFGNVSNLEMRLRSLKSADAPRELRIGMYDSIAVYMFSELSEYLKGIYPDLRIRLHVDSSSKLAERVMSGEIQLCIGANLEQPCKKDFELFTLFTDYYSLYASHRHEKIEAGFAMFVHPEAKDQEDKKLVDYLNVLSQKPTIQDVYNFETIRMLIAKGSGVGVLPTRVAEPFVRSKALKQIAIPKFKSIFGRHDISFLTSKSFALKHRDFFVDIYNFGVKQTV